MSKTIESSVNHSTKAYAMWVGTGEVSRARRFASLTEAKRWAESKTFMREGWTWRWSHVESNGWDEWVLTRFREDGEPVLKVTHLWRGK